MILHKLYNKSYNIIICGDVNINYLLENREKSQLNTILQLYNLSSIINFPTRIALNSSTAIDNFFIDISIIGKYELYPLINGLSDHDAQVLVINNILKPIKIAIPFLQEV